MSQLKPNTRGVLTVTYRPTPDSASVTVQLSDDRWDDLHERLIATGQCATWTPGMTRRWRTLLQHDRQRFAEIAKRGER